MGVRAALFFIFALLLLSLGGLTVLITNVNPYQATGEEKGLFFITFGIFVASLYTLILSRFLVKNARQLAGLSRQGLILGMVLSLLLYLNSLDILTFLDALPIVISGILIEFYLRAEKRV